MEELLRTGRTSVKDCLICKKEKQYGIHILGAFICHKCEKEMVRADVTDDCYSEYVERLKGLETEMFIHVKKKQVIK
ncbi:sigma factor G inhibitor Gin [Salipaludibacillus agaradhaerens]|uniref:sigma factor G inhibitor Gin n=1 Tax=Salipaludibacillus agaradhaerens TaxID=76935 RepID=UPI002151ECCC|nr:sigma factor G inhibitor Gin [Salipaludibacillus agaradhaerens]